MQFLRDYRIGEYCEELFKELRMLCEQAAEGQLTNQHWQNQHCTLKKTTQINPKPCRTLHQLPGKPE